MVAPDPGWPLRVPGAHPSPEQPTGGATRQRRVPKPVAGDRSDGTIGMRRWRKRGEL